MDYEIIRSRRQTLALQVRRDGALVVRAPLRLPQAQIEAFVEGHRAWAERARQRLLRRGAAYPPPTEQEQALLRARARTELAQKVAYYGAQMGLTPSGVRITSARTRFGSCSGKNSLCFSWRLMQYPEAAIDYVVVHELAHIRHHNHSPAFYALVERYMPDWRERMALLR